MRSIAVTCLNYLVSFQKMSLPCFAISEPTVRNMLDNVAFVWNEGIKIAKTLAQGEDWSLFLKVCS